MHLVKHLVWTLYSFHSFKRLWYQHISFLAGSDSAAQPKAKKCRSLSSAVEPLCGALFLVNCSFSDQVFAIYASLVTSILTRVSMLIWLLLTLVISIYFSRHFTSTHGILCLIPEYLFLHLQIVTISAQVNAYSSCWSLYSPYDWRNRLSVFDWTFFFKEKVTNDWIF